MRILGWRIDVNWFLLKMNGIKKERMSDYSRSPVESLFTIGQLCSQPVARPQSDLDITCGKSNRGFTQHNMLIITNDHRH